ncbi:hypothetical protein EDD65_11113 [Keratinibaculum paraultunense]|uniref:Uncharacterized protein n=1 Tax=Keratinibaculum paraultunense TaxID=1278232 RepID=A0A4R3KRS3_9FIRM|nr:DUF6483 family protein [Keratinibaculum paraultunense]QQY78838.1 hypothetical protein JL105_06440 [Keratinibaculum paraultunense]TCS87451.1 hypothetical protein EDD65_11113 [Keratinibaculum paraultunense]
MFEQDYIMRKIRNLVRFLARTFLNKDEVTYELPILEEYTKTDYIHKELIILLEQGKINKAENLLFENLDTDNKRYMELALDFYERLNNFEDDFLEENNFSREEIEEGLKEIFNKFKVPNFFN